MTQSGPWSVKGIDHRAREAAREAARDEGMTLGEYLNRLLLEEERGAPWRPEPPRETARRPAEPASDGTGSALDRLTRRIESAEARSTLAITGIDQSVVGLLARLENAEHGQDAMGAHFDRMIDDLRRTHDSLRDKIARLEADDSGETNLAALKSLEDALGRLASHVYEESALAGEESAALRTRLESGLGELGQRIDEIDAGLGRRVQSEIASQGPVIEAIVTAKAGRLDRQVAEKLAHVDTMGEAMDQVHAQVSAAVSGVNAGLAEIQDRLTRAETTTDTALRQLERTFSHLDRRIEHVAKSSNADAALELRRHFEERFEGLADNLRSLIATARAEMAEEIEAAAKTVDSQVVQTLQRSVETMAGRLEASEARQSETMAMVSETVSRVTSSIDQRLLASQAQQSQAIERVGAQVSRISDAYDERLSQLEASAGIADGEAIREEMRRFTESIDSRLDQFDARDTDAVERVSAQVEALADRLDERVLASEQRSAEAIEQVGEQVSRVAGRLEHRQDEALRAFSEKLDASQKRQETRLSNALANVSERLEDMQQRSAAALSPVQRAIASLAQRIEAIEDFATPGHAMPAASPDPFDTNAGRFDPRQEAALDTAGTGMPDEPFPAGPDLQEPFEAGLESWVGTAGIAQGEPAEADPGRARLVEALNRIRSGFDAMDRPEPAPQAVPDPDPAPAPEPELDWADAREEARDSDIFEDEAAAIDEGLFFDDQVRAPGPETAYGDPDDLPPPPDAPDLSMDVAEESPAASSRPTVANYLAEARAAARAAAATSDTARTPRAGRLPKAAPPQASLDRKPGKGPGRLPLILAASTIAVAGAGAAGYLHLRGKQAAPILSFNARPASPVLAGQADGPSAFGGPEARPVALASLATRLPEPEPEPEPENEAAPAPEAPALPEPLPLIPPAPSIEQAAEAGDPVARFELGLVAIDEGDAATGARLVQAAAASGLSAAQYRLAKLHEQGLGVARDIAEARRWTERAAKGGNVKAMHDLAVYQTNGEGGPQSYTQAAEWYRRAAEYGVVDSQFNLAVFYQDGLGISPSLTEALFWFEVAAAAGDRDASAAAQALAGRVSIEAARQMRTRAANWTAAAPDPSANGEFGPQAWSGEPSPAQIEAAQARLSAFGYEAGPADGALGSQTRDAIRAFAADHGLASEDTLSPALIELLNAIDDPAGF